MGDAPHPSADQARQTRRMWRASVIVAIFLVVSAGWILFYDGPPPDDARMLPQWTPQDPGKPNPLAVFIGEVDSAPWPEFNKLLRLRQRMPGIEFISREHEPALREHMVKEQLNYDAFDKLMSTDPRTWYWPDGERMADLGYGYPDLVSGQIAQIQRFRVHLLKLDGKFEEAVARSLDLARFGAGQQSAEGMLIHLLVGLTCQRLGEEALQDVLADAPVSPEFLKSTLRQMEAIPPPSREGCQFAYKGEYLVFKNATKKLGHGTPTASGTTPITTVIQNRFSALFFKRNRTLSARLELEWPAVEALDRGWAEALAATAASRRLATDYRLSRGRPTTFLDPNFVGTMLLANSVGDAGRIVERAMFSDALKRQTELMLALRLFELEKGRLPEKLDELVPGYMATVPVDVFTGKPMRWDPVHEVVYSVGANGVDDVGRIDPKKPYKGLDVGMRYWWNKLPDAPVAPTKP